MARTYYRFLTAIALAVAIEHLHADLFTTWPTLGRARLALAQLVHDAALDDPNVVGGYGASGSAGRNGYPAAPYYNTGPSAPTHPGSPTRPSSWPGGSQDPAGAAAPGAAVQPPPGVPTAAPSAVRKSPTDPPFDPATIVAHVGSEVIQANEILPSLNQRLALIMAEKSQEIGQLPPDERRAQIDELQRLLMKQFVQDMIKLKLLVSDVRHKVPAEGLSKHEEIFRKDFNSRMIKNLMADYKASSIIDLENKLRESGSSLEAQRTVYIEQGLAVGWLGQQTKEEQEPSHEQMLTYYREHSSEWETPARVRWEQLTVKFDNFDSKRSAYRALAQWGNEIRRGAPFGAVAKAHSQGITAEEGGAHDWTSKGSLRSTVLDEVLFGLPEGMLSQILEDADGFHIVRVVQREDLKQTPFTEVQAEIKKRLRDGNKDKQKAAYIAKLRERTPVWTIFDETAYSTAQRPGAPPVR
ncbi:MAG: peptidylprolyl isomerase [Planctomycetia bacterium]|nr:peptidylprolyl isomerase [Planctomycetia bacterium]